MNALAEYYAKRAPEYERIYQKPERQGDLHALREVVARTFAGRSVLEIACGTGWWTEVFANAAPFVAATDINEEVLAIARAKFFGSHVELLRCDAFALDSIPGEFNAAFAAFWWSHLSRPQLKQFLAGLHRKLRPGSVVMFIDNSFVAGSSTPIARRDADGNTFQLRHLDDGSAVEVMKNFPTDEEIAGLLSPSATGMKIERLTYYWQVCYTVADLQTGI